MATTYTFTTTDQQDADTQWLVDQYNAGNPGATLTTAQFVQAQITNALADASRQVDAARADYVIRNIQTATPAVKAQVVTLLKTA